MHRSRLRHIAVHVEEPTDGAFHWVLTERGEGDEWSELDRARDEAATYRQAMADGLLALQALVADLDTGPRTGAAPTGDKRGGRGDDASAMEPDGEVPAPAARKRAFFGFGPAR